MADQNPTGNPVVPPPPPTGNPPAPQPPFTPEPGEPPAPTPINPPPSRPGQNAPIDPSATGTTGTTGDVVDDAVVVVADLHSLAMEVKAEYDAASPQTKLAFEQLLRDATILRGEGFLALKKLLGK